MSAEQRVPGLHVSERGHGEPVLFVHGGLMDGETAWSAQQPLERRFRVLRVDRFGYGGSEDRPDATRIEADVQAVVELLSGGAHLVGHSYGGLICLLAAARSPASVLSLTVIEPPAFSLVRGDPHVEALIGRMAVALPAAREMSPPDAIKTFFDALGLVGNGPMSAPVERATRSTFREPPPWELDVPLAALTAAHTRTLVVSGGWAGDVSNQVRHSAGMAFELTCNLLAERLISQRAVITGATHGVQFTGQPFNVLLERFLDSGTAPLTA